MTSKEYVKTALDILVELAEFHKQHDPRISAMASEVIITTSHQWMPIMNEKDYTATTEDFKDFRSKIDSVADIWKDLLKGNRNKNKDITE